MKTCGRCGGAILTGGVTWGYAGPICTCNWQLATPYVEPAYQKFIEDALEKDKRIAELTEQRDELYEALLGTRRELDACQRVLWLAQDYGFDPAYVKDAQAAIKKADQAIAKAENNAS